MLNLITGLLPVAERVLDKVLPDPEAKAKAILELQKLEQNGELRKIEAEHTNTASAREREVAVVTSNVAPFINKIIVPCLAILIVFLTFGMMSAILFMDIESGKNYEISLYILVLLSGALMSCINYYFGSSTGSKEKSKELQDMFSKKEPKL